MSRVGRWLYPFFEICRLARDVPLAAIGSAVILPVPTLRRLMDGDDPNATRDRYAVYASYDKNGLISDYVVEQLASVARLGYRIVYVCASPCLPDDQVSKVTRYCWKVLWRRNIGHDFASYKHGIRQIGSLNRIEQLLLMNDSCYGPLFSLDLVDSLGPTERANFWGVTDSWHSRYHLQSYFLVFDRKALSSRAFRRFWNFLPPYQSRRLAIRTGEIRLTKWLLRGGMRAAVLCPYRAVAARSLRLILKRLHDCEAVFLPKERQYLERLAEAITVGLPLNSMHSFWDVLIAEFRCPFIKRNLLRENPARIPGLIEWPEFIGAHTRYPPMLIEEHVKLG